MNEIINILNKDGSTIPDFAFSLRLQGGSPILSLYIKKKMLVFSLSWIFCICSDFCKYCITNIILLTTELLSASSLSHFLPGSLTLPHPSLAAPRGSAQDVLAIVTAAVC